MLSSIGRSHGDYPIAPAIVGLLLAWGGTAFLVGPVAGLFADSTSIASGLVAQIALWIVFMDIVCIVVYWEKQPVASLWLKPLEWQSFAWASALTLFSIVVMFPLTEWVRTAAGLSGYTIGMEATLAYPVWLRVIAVLTAGVVEETLFRGFAVTRLMRLGASVPVAIGLASIVFASLHLPYWGSGPSLAFFLGSLITTAFFVWRRDLLAMIVAHIAIDMWALVIAPAWTRWWA